MKIKPLLSTIMNIISDNVLPLSCLLCRQHCPHPLALCEACVALITSADSAQSSDTSTLLSSSSFSNTSLSSNNDNQPWDKIRYLSAYQTPLKELIQKGKFDNNLAVFKVLGQLLALQIQQQGYDPDLVIIPVPLYADRLIERGYNQANEIALPLASQLSLSINNDTVVRVKKAQTQHFLSKQQRLLNAAHLFECMAFVPKKVAIIDDVYTTGATMRSICTCLKNAGTQMIEVWIIARTLKAS